MINCGTLPVLKELFPDSKETYLSKGKDRLPKRRHHNGPHSAMVHLCRDSFRAQSVGKRGGVRATPSCHRPASPSEATASSKSCRAPQRSSRWPIVFTTPGGCLSWFAPMRRGAGTGTSCPQLGRWRRSLASSARLASGSRWESGGRNHPSVVFFHPCPVSASESPRAGAEVAGSNN